MSDVKKGRGFHVVNSIRGFKNTRHSFQTRMSFGSSAVFIRENKRADLLEYLSDNVLGYTDIKAGSSVFSYYSPEA